MATSSVAESNQQLWDETLGRLLNLSSVTLKRNAELENRVAELEVELAVWKQAHATVLEGADKEAKALKVPLFRQLPSEHFQLKNHTLLVLCVIDGDACIFNDALLRQGHEGGRQAAQQLTKAVAEFLTRENVHTLGHLSFWITVYYNRLGLINVLERHKLCSPEQFEAFVMGFSQTSPRFSLVDVGYGRDATFTKIAEYLQTYIRFPQTQRIFLAGSCDNTYVSTITALESDDLLNKLTILEKTGDDQDLSRRFRLPTLTLENVFMPQSPRDSNGGLPTPHSPPVLSVSTNGKLIDPTLPLHKHSPPPCNEFYLMSCTKGSTCKYSHEYVLTPEQLATLAANAKKAPCNFLKNGIQCPYGERCCWGHTCPNGPKCFHLSKGKCWFKGESMHSLSFVQTS
ncbi:hypothetical protein EDD17DRAFT_308926 [Pisolithus thermaeus]|nr:hypothetical protein EDD17DRAFT_308926 [Pisolithus thermaeus]